MSLAFRTALVARLHFNDEQAKADLLNENLTNTLLIQMIDDIERRAKLPLLITAVRSDHGYDGYLGGWAHSDGGSVDLWHANWATIGDEHIRDVAAATLASPYAWSMGYGGSAQTYCASIISKDPRFIIFGDDKQDHLHAQCGNSNGSGHR